MKSLSIVLIVIALMLSACASAGNNNNNTAEEVVSTDPDGAVEALTHTPGAPLEPTAGTAAAPALLATPQAVEASTLAANINNTEVAGQSGRIGQVLGIVMDAASGQARYLVVRTLGLEVEKTALLPMGAYKIALLAPGQAAETGNLLPVVWLTVPDGDLAAAPEIDPGIFTDTEQLISEWDQESSQYWASRVAELPVTGEGDGRISQENLLYLSGSLLEDFNIPVVDAQGGELGEILDFVIDPGGKVTFAALRPIGLEDGFDEVIAVPASQLTWDASQRTYATSLSGDELRAAPRFDRSELPDMTIPGWEQPWDKYWGQLSTGSPVPPKTEVGKQVKVSHLIGMQVFDVTNAALGEVEDMILGQNGAIQYLVVRSGNQYRPVPWIGFDFDFTEGILTYLDDVTRLQEAPGFANLEAIDPTDPNWDEQIRGYWGLSR